MTKLSCIFICASALPALIYLPMILLKADMSQLLYWFILLLIFLGAPWTLGWTRGWKVGLTAFAALSLSMIASFALFAESYTVRTAFRWTFHSKMYKREVLEQQGPLPGLQHVEWDGWGWGGQDTYVYLVYDPKDRLREAIKTSTGVIAEGLPCEVSQIRRLEIYWYIVIFPIDGEWTNC